MTTIEDMSAGFINLRPGIVTAFPIGGETMADAMARARRTYPRRPGILISRERAAELAARSR